MSEPRIITVKNTFASKAWAIIRESILHPFSPSILHVQSSDPDAPYAVGPCHCIGCGHRSVNVVPTKSPCYNAETGAIDMAECSACGKFLVCSE